VNPLLVTVNGDIEVKANFKLPDYTDDYESGDFNPALAYNLGPAGSAAPWYVQDGTAAGGEFAASSGVISSFESSSLQLTADLDAGVGSFAVRISSENNFDRMTFSLNGVPVSSWVGEVSWRTFEFEVAAGKNVLEWRYEKDATLSAGLDAAFIDDLALPLASDEGTEPELDMARVQDNIRLLLRGAPGRTYNVEVSNDLMTWTPVGSVIAQGGMIPVSVPASSGERALFYRAVKP
jgi:hypothetical protein